MALTCNEFKREIEAEFGKCEWKAVKGDESAVSKGWPSDKKHPANAPDSRYVKPCMDYLIGRKNGK